MGTIDAFDAMDDALSIRLLQKYPSDSDEGQAALRLSETAREARGLRAANKSLRERLEALREEIRRG